MVPAMGFMRDLGQGQDDNLLGRSWQPPEGLAVSSLAAAEETLVCPPVWHLSNSTWEEARARDTPGGRQHSPRPRRLLLGVHFIPSGLPTESKMAAWPFLPGANGQRRQY